VAGIRIPPPAPSWQKYQWIYSGKHWTEAAYRNVTENFTILPFKVTCDELILIFVDVDVTILGAVKKDKG